MQLMDNAAGVSTGYWAVVRDGDGTILGRHRTAVGAWEITLSYLQRGANFVEANKNNFRTF
jgi:hypothetical protein